MNFIKEVKRQGNVVNGDKVSLKAVFLRCVKSVRNVSLRAKMSVSEFLRGNPHLTCCLREFFKKRTINSRIFKMVKPNSLQAVDCHDFALLTHAKSRNDRLGAGSKVPLPCGGGFRGWVFKALALKCYLKQRQGFEFMFGFVAKVAYFLLGNYFYFLLRKNTHPQTPSAREGAFQGANFAKALPLDNATSQGALKRTSCVVDSSPFFKRLRMTSGKAFSRTAPRYAFLAFALALLLLTPNSAKAEQSGWFVGVQAGYGLGDRKRQLEATVKRTTNIQNNRYVFADEFGNINTIQKEERLDGITGRWNQAANDTYKGAGGDSKVNGYLGTGTILNTYKIVDTFTFDPTDTSTWKGIATGITNYIPGGSSYNNNTWTSGTTNAKDNRREMVEMNDSLQGLNAGLLAGYKHFFSTKLGLRVYGLLDYSYYKDNDTALQKMQAYNANLNLDLLYNLYDKNERIMGVFAGLSVGGAQYISSNTRLASDIDIGLNFGLRFGAGKHSIELFSRVGGLFVGAEHYDTSDTAYSSENMWLDSSTNNMLNFSTSLPASVAGIRVCPASATECGTAGTTAAYNGYEKSGTGTTALQQAQNSQYRYRVFRYQYRDTYIREVTEATAGSRLIDSYRQPYKIGIRYIYSF